MKVKVKDGELDKLCKKYGFILGFVGNDEYKKYPSEIILEASPASEELEKCDCGAKTKSHKDGCTIWGNGGKCDTCGEKRAQIHGTCDKCCQCCDPEIDSPQKPCTQT